MFSTVCTILLQVVLFLLFQLESAGIQAVILTFLLYKRFMVAALDNFSVFKHHNRMTVADGGKSVRYYENCPALHKLIHTLLYEDTAPRGQGGLLRRLFG